MTTKPPINASKIKQPNKGNSLLMPLPLYLYVSLAILWLYSGIMPVLFAPTESLAMLAQLGIPQNYQAPLFIIASLIDVIFGLLILSPYRQVRLLWLVQLSVVVSYSIIIAIGLPENWFHPFAPLIKNIPIMALLLFMVQKHSPKSNAILRGSKLKT